jgi:hypothetical protein
VVKKEFQPSTLSKEQQLKEMEWFVNAAKPFKGLEINVLSETIPTHEYEARVLTKAFQEITGIKVNHQLLGEGSDDDSHRGHLRLRARSPGGGGGVDDRSRGVRDLLRAELHREGVLTRAGVTG